MARKLDLSANKALLDIAGGSGIYSCALVANHPHLRASVFEKKPVDRIARENIAKRGYTEKVDVLVGDMFADAWPTDFDVHLISNVLHDWDEDPVRKLLSKSYAALPTGGSLIVHDVHINAEKTGPLHAAEYSALLMNITEGKCYSVGEMRTYLNEIGFEWADYQPTAVGRSFILAKKP
jgi:acetylserotonin N-methyltransferase